MNGAAAGAVAYGVAVFSSSSNNFVNDTSKISGNKGSDTTSNGTEGIGKPKTGVNKNGEMLGKNGTRVDNDTKCQNGKTERVDVENPNPGKRPGDVHYHDANNTKYRFDPVTGKRYDEAGNLAPNKVQKVLGNKDIQKALNKAIQVLGEEKYF